MSTLTRPPRLLALALLVASSAACVVTARPAAVVVREAPPPPRVEVIPAPPGPAFVWIAGCWRWNNRWVWLPGHYERRPRRAAVWVDGHWTADRGRWIWIPGHWR